MPEVDGQAETIRVDDLEITPSEGLVRAGSMVLTLSVREFQLLVAMVRHGRSGSASCAVATAPWTST
jgi:DNA-binding response OmpR family regulator